MSQAGQGGLAKREFQDFCKKALGQVDAAGEQG